MRFILVPNVQSGKRYKEAMHSIPLGVLSLATVLSNVNFVSTHPVDPRDVDFRPPSHTVERILDLEPDVVGFSTMCNSYPYALRTAQILKQIKPDVMIVFGGAHATVVGKETLDCFGFVDFILAGECERSIIDFVTFLVMRDRRPEDVPGLVFRKNEVPVQSGFRYPMLPPDELPDIKYELLRDLRDFPTIPLDVGRGCPYSCTFCTTSAFWERRYRLRSTDYIINTVKKLQSEYNVNLFNLVHDNFTASSGRVTKFCEQVIESGVKFHWHCSARPDTVDDNLLELMSSAGCRKIFMGIESGSPRIQKLCNKNIRLDRVIPVINKVMGMGMNITTSFITGFPYESSEDIENTLCLMSNINYYARTRCDLFVQLLSPTPGASILDEPNVELALDDSISDISYAGLLDQTMKDWIINNGRPIFSSFFHFTNTAVPRSKFVAFQLGWFITFGRLRFTALALEAARRLDHFELMSVFSTSEPVFSEYAWTGFQWCVSSVRTFLKNSGYPWAESISAVLDFEAERYRLSRFGGSCVLESNFDVKKWMEDVVGGASNQDFPPPARVRYLIRSDSDRVKVFYLPVAYPAV